MFSCLHLLLLMLPCLSSLAPFLVQAQTPSPSVTSAVSLFVVKDGKSPPSATYGRGIFAGVDENRSGHPGSGKTHLLCAICHELARQGRRVYFSACDLIVQQLLRAKRDLELDKLLKKLSRFDALMIDDFGYVKQDRDEMEVLFTLLAHRYERGSMLITSNLPFSKWEVIFKDPMTTAAAIDRLVHHSVVLELNVPSYRAEQAKKRKKQDK